MSGLLVPFAMTRHENGACGGQDRTRWMTALNLAAERLKTSTRAKIPAPLL